MKNWSEGWWRGYRYYDYPLQNSSDSHSQGDTWTYVTEKRPVSLEMFSTSLTRGGIWRRSGMKQWDRKNTKALVVLRTAEEAWILFQCEQIGNCLGEKQQSKVFQLVKDLTGERKDWSKNKSKSGKCLTEEPSDSQDSDRVLLRGIFTWDLW